MLTSEERNLIYQRAYLPEHLIDYVESISGAEACIHYDHLYFTMGDHLIFIGYPLGTQSNTQQVYELVCDRFQPVTVAIIAPQQLLVSYPQLTSLRYLLERCQQTQC